MTTISDILSALDSLGYGSDDDYFGINIDDNGDGTYTAYNNPGTTDFSDIDGTMVNLQNYDVDGDRSIFTCFV